MRKTSSRRGALTSADEAPDARAVEVSPLSWYPRLERATMEQRERWQLSGAGYAIHWPEIDEDLSTEGLLRGARAPRGSESFRSPFVDWGPR